MSERVVCGVILFVFVIGGCGRGEPEPSLSPDAGEDVIADMREGAPDMSRDMSSADRDMPAVIERDMGLAACAEEVASAWEATTLGDWVVEVHGVTGRWRVKAPGGEVLGARGCVDDGEAEIQTPVRVATGRPSVKYAFGSSRINTNVVAMDWIEPTSAPMVTQREGELRLEYQLVRDDSSGSVSLVFEVRDERHLQLSLETDLDGVTAGEFSLECSPGESFFGLGAQVTGMDLRGERYPMWTTEQGIDKPEGGGLFPLQNFPGASYAPMGVLHSSMGWSALLTHDGYSEFDLCARQEDRALVRSYRAMPGLVFVAGETPRERMKSVTDYTGRYKPAARWVYGPWNDTVGGIERVLEVADTLRENAIPSSAIWAEDWAGGGLTPNGYGLSYAYEWDPVTYPTLPTDIDALHARGFAFLAYFNTFIVETTPMWQEALDGDFAIKDDAGEMYVFQEPFFRDSSMTDLTSEAARGWMYAYMHRAASDLGIDGWMADYAEWLPPDAVVSDGRGGWEAHNEYPLRWQQLNRDVFEDVHDQDPSSPGWIYWVRSGWASVNGGTAGIAPAMWGGDQNTDWGYDDGFPTVLPIGAHLGLAGVAVYGSDIAGYSWIGPGDILSTKELFMRWSSVGALSPLMRTHQGAAKCKNWSFERDAETLAHYKRYASVHTLLLPYFEALQVEAVRDGLPMIRHPYLVEPGAARLWDGEHYAYFLGDALWVSPVLEAGRTTWEVELPGAGWWPLFGDGPLDTERVTAVAPATEIPAYVRPGTILPLLGEVVETFYGASDDGVTDLSDVEDHYRIGLYPGADGSLDSISFADVEISGASWQEAPSWDGALVDGVPLEACSDEAELEQSCVSATGVVLLGRGGMLSVNGATLTWSAGRDVRLDVMVGGDVFGQLADATPLEELDSMAPPVCENREFEE